MSKPSEQELREYYQQMRLIDNELMTIAFNENTEAVEYVIQTILNRKDLTVISATTQEWKVLPYYRKAVVLDIVARDEQGRVYNIEMQGKPERATAERARYYRSIIDSEMLSRGDDYADLQEVYIIFITDGPFLGLGNQVPIEFYRMMGERTKTRLNDKQTVVFVNVRAKQDTKELQQLVKDLTARSANEIYSNVLKSAVECAKGSEGEKMYIEGSYQEKVWNEATLATKKENIKSCFKNGASFDFLEKSFGLSIDEIKAILEEK